ncbi:MAG: PEP-CTERM sorting domain-containing protein [Myxococcota bacterium]
MQGWISLVAACLLAAPSSAVVTVTDPDDGSVFPGLYRPTGKFDETSLSGFEFLISSRMGEFRENDQYVISGEETDEATSIGHDLGAVGDLSETPFDFTIEHNLIGGRNFTFAVTNTLTSATDTLCWGENCAPGSTSVELLDGIPPIESYNGLQIQVRAQDVVDASARVTITALSGVSVAGADFFDETVVLSSPGTISVFDPGRRGQWMLGNDLDLVENEWALEGTVTLTRPDEALVDLTKVRLAVDLVRDPSLPYIEAPEPATPLMLGMGSLVLMFSSLRRRRGRSLDDDDEQTPREP